ncbi:MAG: ABC transporter permease [Gemmatimonadetes bacterium]|nr:ABC transporter permease [Gemmatimonadota bacterium]
MSARTPDGPPLFLRLLARWLVRGPEAPFVRADLEELMARDRERGMSARRAGSRYARNLLGSAISTWRAGLRTPRFPGGSWLDVRLGFRMLVKYPALTLVGGLAMAFAVWVGAGSFEFLTQNLHPSLPLPEGHRVVGIRVWDAAEGGPEERIAHEFGIWRGELESVGELGAFRTLERNLLLGEGHGQPVQVAEMTASGFRVARVPPILGRYLNDADERVGAPAVVVLGHETWRMHFGGDPTVIGRAVRLGDSRRTVVGVMPEDFAFPVAHDAWMPLRADVLEHEPRGGPPIRVFGRLAPGTSRTEAQSEVTAVGRRLAAELGESHEHLRPQVLPYARSIMDVSGEVTLSLGAINLFFLMLLVLVCGNIALLLFARAATREGEIVVRSALGASRGRILTQLFIEAVVLLGAAAAVGLSAASLALEWWLGVAEIEAGGRLPFWFDAALSPSTVLYTGLLTVVGAVIAGVVPALKLTGRGVEGPLRQAAAGAGGLRFGGVWTAVIVAQVAVTVAFPVFAFVMRREVVQIRSFDVGFPAEEYLSARIDLDRESASGPSADSSQAAHLTRVGAAYRELEQRLEAEPAVAGVTFSERLPGTYHPQGWLEVEDGPAPGDDSGLRPKASLVSVDADYFDVLGAPILSGRGFHPGDLGSEPRPVIVNQSFVNDVLGGQSPVGRRVRFARPPEAEPGPWYEIVGAVRDLGMISGDLYGAGLYRPAAAGETTALHLAVHMRGDPASFAPRLRALATTVDPGLRLHEILPLDEVGITMWLESQFIFRLLIIVSSIALLLSLAGIYSAMSFAVSRRTREIGVRVALGADARRVAAAIFRRPLTQVAAGIAVGGTLTAALILALSGGAVSARGFAMVAAYLTLMVGVCLLACIVPTRRALSLEPTEALRAEG